MPSLPYSDSLLIKNAVRVSSSGMEEANVLIRDGKIAAVGSGDLGGADSVLNARGLHLFPGVTDPQVHFRDPGLEWKEDLETGSRGAAAGGVTSYLEMPNTKPATITGELLEKKKAVAARKSLVNYGFFIGATAENVDELNAARNACGIKIFMGASTGDLLVHRHADLDRIFSRGRRLIAVHAEDEEMIRQAKLDYAQSRDVHDHPKIRSAEAALRATQVAVGLSQKYGRRLHVLHLTTAEEAEFLRVQKAASPPGLISAEVCPQHFLLKAPEAYDRLGTYAQMNPPIRDARHGAALWQALRDGVIDCIATDHAPHTREEKDKGYPESPSGMPGVETSFPLLLNQVSQGLCSPMEVAKWMCEKPCELYGMVGKGRIEVGYDADLVLVDMNLERTIRDGEMQTKVGWTPYHGWTTRGWPVMTLVHGHMVYGEGEFFTERKGREILFDAPWERPAR